MQVTLTFDNGPEPEVTPAVLGTLARRQVPSTFFVLGHKIASPERRALAERAHAEGHWIGNHTYNHKLPFGECGADDPSEPEIGRTQSLLGHLTHPQRLFRPFGKGGQLGPHLLNPAALAYLKAGRYTCVLWNAIPRDWENPAGWVDLALAQCRAQPWSLVVLHDLPTGAMAKLDEFIGRVLDEGGRFRQDFPEDCVPLQSGRETLPLAGLVATVA